MGPKFTITPVCVWSPLEVHLVCVHRPFDNFPPLEVCILSVLIGDVVVPPPLEVCRVSRSN